MSAHPGWLLPLFVPTTRPDRFAKAATSGTDAIVVDLEDAVPVDGKAEARSHLGASIGLGVDTILRINARGSPWYADDLRAAASLAFDAIMVPKVDGADVVAEAHALSGGKPVIALIETLGGVERLDEIAGANGCAQLGFGTQDFAGEMGCGPRSRLFDTVRFNMLCASRRAGMAPPLDGTSLLLDDSEGDDAAGRELVEIGFAGRFCIHPAQVTPLTPLARGLRPTEAEIDRATRVLEAPDGAARVDGTMVDQPVRIQMQNILRRASRLKATNL
jgi:citrate lyase subunit beta/citryl-CoA lyase